LKSVDQRGTHVRIYGRSCRFAVQSLAADDPKFIWQSDFGFIREPGGSRCL